MAKTLSPSDSVTFGQSEETQRQLYFRAEGHRVLNTGHFSGSVKNRDKERQVTFLFLPLGDRNLKFCLNFSFKLYMEIFKVSDEEIVKK